MRRANASYSYRKIKNAISDIAFKLLDGYLSTEYNGFPILILPVPLFMAWLISVLFL